MVYVCLCVLIVKKEYSNIGKRSCLKSRVLRIQSDPKEGITVQLRIYLHVKDGHLGGAFFLFLWGIGGKSHDKVCQPWLLAAQCQRVGGVAILGERGGKHLCA